MIFAIKEPSPILKIKFSADPYCHGDEALVICLSYNIFGEYGQIRVPTC